MILINEQQLLELYRKFELLKNCKKKSERKAYLEEFQDDELFLYVLEFLMNTHKKTGISDAKLKKEFSDADIQISEKTLEELLDYLVKNNSGKNKDIIEAQCFIYTVKNFTLKGFVKELITKKYKCGMTAKFVCEVLPDLVKLEHQVMLANKYKGELDKMMQVSLKLDGVRCTMIVHHDGTMKFLTRQGKEIKGLDQIKSVLKNRMLEGYVFDGELLKLNPDNLPSEVNFKETQKIIASKEPLKKGLEFVIFDVVPLEDYLKQSCDIPFEQRFKTLIGKIGIGNQFVRIVPIYGRTDDPAVVDDRLNKVVASGHEGLMLNAINGLYKFGKRSNDLLKVKQFHSCDLKCIAVEEGEGKYAGTLGAIICDYKGFQLKVGSGFTDEERAHYWNNQDEIVNKIVEIKYFEESTNEQGGLSLRFPTWLRLRDDKNDVSYE